LNGVAGRETPFSSNKTNAKRRIRPAKFTDASGQSMSYSMSYFSRIQRLVFTKVLISLEKSEVVAGGGIEPPTQGFSVLCSTD
jgi:hypothetical protein